MHGRFGQRSAVRCSNAMSGSTPLNEAATTQSRSFVASGDVGLRATSHGVTKRAWRSASFWNSGAENIETFWSEMPICGGVAAAAVPAGTAIRAAAMRARAAKRIDPTHRPRPPRT